MVNVKFKFALLVNVKQKLMIKVKVTQPKENFYVVILKKWIPDQRAWFLVVMGANSSFYFLTE